MAVNVLITRRFKPEYLHEAHTHNAELRALATVQEGYLHGKSLISREDPQKIIVISSWDSAADWERWHASDNRKDYYKKLRMALEESEKIEIFDVGRKQ
jgi:heme oxygenase (mycobilin-producing)